jgi:hypothetical protein
MQTTLSRSAYSYTDLALDQYDAIIMAGSMGNASPMHGKENYDALLAACQSIDADPRVLLAGLLFEDHFGGDPNGAAAASVNNFSGIKWAGQAIATDSGVPADTGGTYARFATIGLFFQEYARTLVNQYIGPYFKAGDLANAWSVYITGFPNSGHGQERVDQWAYYLVHYPPGSGSGPVPVGVYGEDLVVKARTQIGNPFSGTYDPRNGNHAWAYWCRAFVESTGRNCGLDVVAHNSALEAQHAAADQGLLNTTDRPEHGAVCQMDTRFYFPDGHTFYWDADKGMALGTLTDGTGVGYRDWGPGTFGWAGWYRLPGVVGARRSAPPSPPPPPSPDNNLVIPNNPYNAGRKPPHEVGVGGGIRAKWEGVPDPLTIFGFPVSNEQQALVTETDGRTVRQRTVQRFERLTLIYQPENKGTPFEVVAALRGQTITEITP